MTAGLGCLGFSLFGGISPQMFRSLVLYFGNAEKAYQASTDLLLPILGARLCRQFSDFRKETDLRAAVRQLAAEGIGYLAWNQPDYPPLLRQIFDPPIGLFFRGEMKAFKFNQTVGCAVVGSRQPSEYGRKMAKHFAGRLAALGIVIVSGLALGIDAVAHSACLAAGGKTIAVLGCGLNIVYPPANRPLYNDIVKRHGLVVSEIAPDKRVKRAFFANRNRLIAGLCRGVLIVEGSDRSGTLLTAKAALNEGREVMAVPGQVGETTAFAPNLLIKHGAVPVTSLEDVLAALGVERRYNA